MNTYTMTCPCGDVMTVQADNRAAAVAELKGQMTAEAIAAHMAEKHPGQEVMTVEACHAMIEQDTMPKEDAMPAAA